MNLKYFFQDEIPKFAVPECIKELYKKRWNYWKKDELPSEEEQDAWFANVIRMQKMQVELDLCVDNSCELSDKQSMGNLEMIEDVRPETLNRDTTSNIEQNYEPDIRNDVLSQSSALVSI